MYTTRPLSLYKNSPEAVSQPPEGPNSGYLVIQDDDSTPTSCFGLCKNPAIRDLPFPQNKLLSIEFHIQAGASSYHRYDIVYLIPVINQPLSSNMYYAIKADGKRKGETYASSKENDKVTSCFCIPCMKDVKPRAFNHEDIYQQFEFSATKNCLNAKILSAKSVAPDGHPPYFLRRCGWQMNGKTPNNFTLGEAHGLNSSLRTHLPDFNFSVSQQCSNDSLVVGKWYCPYMFIHEGTEKEQIKHSAFYEMTLERRWDRIFNADNKDYSQQKVVMVDAVVLTRVVKIDGRQVEETCQNDENGVVWFKSNDGNVGVSKLIVERMMWEEERVGWIKGKDDEKQVRVVKDEEYEGVIGWRSFGCYVLVESFVLKRNDGTVVLTFDFMHTHTLRCNWE